MQRYNENSINNSTICTIISIVLGLLILVSMYNSAHVYSLIRDEILTSNDKLSYLEDIDELINDIYSQNDIINMYFNTKDIDSITSLITQSSNQNVFSKFKSLKYGIETQGTLKDVVENYEEIEIMKKKILAYICIYADVSTDDMNYEILNIIDDEIVKNYLSDSDIYINKAEELFYGTNFNERVYKLEKLLKSLATKTMQEAIFETKMSCKKIYVVLTEQLIRLIICVVLYMFYIYIYYKYNIYPLNTYIKKLKKFDADDEILLEPCKYSDFNIIADRVNNIYSKMRNADLENKMKYNYMIKMIYEMKISLKSMLEHLEITSKKEISEDLRSEIDYLYSEMGYLSSTTNKIIDVSKIEIGKFEVNNAHYYTNNLFLRIVNLLKNQIEGKNIKFEYSIDETLPSKLFGDEERILQIALNLLDNACKYTKIGKIGFNVFGEYISDDRIKLIIKVDDTGVGINVENKDKIFTERRDSQSYLGVGLLVSKKISNILGGDITFESEHGKGSTFIATVVQKVVDKREIKDVPVDNTNEEFKNNFISTDANVLIVDENSLNSNKMLKMLEPYKMQVDSVKNYDFIANKLTRRQYNIIIINFYDSDEDYQKLEMIFNIIKYINQKNLKVILLTPEKHFKNTSNEIENMIDDYVTKPINPFELERALEKALSQSYIKYLEN